MGEWHPIMAAQEREPGTWVMADPAGAEYGTVQIRRVVDGIRYKAVYRGVHIGWATTLRGACAGVHSAFLQSLGPSGRSGAPMDWELAQQREKRPAPTDRRSGE